MIKKIWLERTSPKFIKLIMVNIFVALFCILTVSFGCQSNGTTEVLLSDKGYALHSVVVGAGASDRTREAAKDLAEYLSLITGGKFEVKAGDGTVGIAVGSYQDFPSLGLDSLFNPKDLTRRDEYLLRTHDDGVYLIGATDLAAQHAVWGFLYELGYRQFFPTDTWEYIPEEPGLRVELDNFEQPDFYNRDGPRIVTWGTPSDSNLWLRWHDRNRVTPSIVMETDHEYPNIIKRNKQTFDEHPEYLALVGGVRGGGRGDKFCISNENLRLLVVEDAKQRVINNPENLYFSVDPSDGGDWCECEECAKLGSISDRVVLLANDVAEEINKMGYGERLVGILAYNQHCPPTNLEVHPKVVVSIATSFLRGGYTFDDLIKGWSKRAKMIGIREYYGTFVWDQGMPREGNGGSVHYLAEKIPYYYNNGARYMNANSTDAWYSYGLGFYLSTRFLWDLKEVERTDELIDDFLVKMFGEARGPMRKFYHLVALDYDSPHTTEDILAQLYGYIKEAQGLTDNPKVIARLDDLALYTRYVELWFGFRNAGGADDRKKAAQDTYRHAYRMQGRMMSSAGQLYEYLIRPSFHFEIPDGIRPKSLSVGMALEDMYPWMSSKPFTKNEITGFVENGVATYKKDAMDFKPVAFDENLEPAVLKLDLRKVTTGNMGRANTFSGNIMMYTWLEKEKELSLKVAGGLNYRDRGNIRFLLFSPKKALVEPVDTDENVPPDGETYKVVLKSPYDGKHELEWMDGLGSTRIEWTEGQPMTLMASMEKPALLGNSARLYFYVPKGTKTVGGYVNSTDFQMFDSAEDCVLDLRNTEGGEGYFNVPVPRGQDGTLWELRCSNVTLRLMTVPPYLARNEKELLLPAEVIESDMKK